jgi:hypothetical protein
VVLQRFAVLLAIIISSGIGLLAQNVPEQNPLSGLRLAGMIRTADGIPVPGATVRVVQTSSGRAWVSWTDEKGNFELPGLPEGRFRIEATQLGFVPATKEIDFKAGFSPSVEVRLGVATLAALSGNTSSQSASNAPSGTRGIELESPRANGAGPQGPGEAGPLDQSNAQQGARRFPGPGGFGRNGPPAGPGGERTGGQPGFQQVGLNGNAQGQSGMPNESEASVPEEGPLGQASSSDAFLMSGTVARGAAPDLSVVAFGGPPGSGPGQADQEAPAGTFGGGGPGGPEGGGPGGPGGGPVVFIGGGGGGGRGPMMRGSGRFGPRGPQGVGPLWGAARVRRQRINRIHFSLYDTYSNSAVDARPYSLTGTTPTKIPSWDEQFGGNVGGPLKIPHVYDGTDKTFFFVNYELGWSRDPVDQFASVPTDAERGGEFSDRGVQLFDPVTLAPLGSSIPTTMMNQAALGLLDYIPHANLPGFVNNFHLQTRVPGATNRLNVMVVHTLSSRFHLMVNYHLSDGHSHAFQSFPDLESNQDTRGQSVTLGLTQNWTRTFLHDSRLYYSRNRSQALNQFAFNTDVAGQLGITGVSTDPINYGVPQLNFTNFSGANDPVPSLIRNQTFRYVDSFSIMKSKHTVKTGFEIRRIETNTRTDPTPRGAFTFDGLLTAQLGSNGLPIPGTGFDFADFLLGLPQATTIRYGASSTYFRSWGYAAYAQDDWRVAPKFTLQYGIRYEATTPPVELNNRIANLDVSPDFTQAQVVTPGEAAPYSGTLPRSLLRGDYNNWSPRIGFAWQPPGKWFSGRNQTTIRAGYGIFYNGSIYGQLDAAMASQPPFAQAQTLQTSATLPLTLENGFPPAPPSVVSNTVAVNPDYRVGYAQIWNFSIERPLAPNTVLNLTYTGTKGTSLDLLLGLSRTPVPGQPGTGAVLNALGFTYDTSGASSIYHGLQVRILRRFNHGLMLNGTYTYSKSIDNASSIGGGQQLIAQDSGDPSAERGLSSFDMRHQLRIGYMYELPFGERKRWANGGWTGSVFGNWRFSGSFTAHSGTPFTARVFSGSCSVVGGIFSERANQVGDPNLPASERTTALWFNTAAFALPSGCIGDASRNSITGPGQFVWNAGLSKTIPLGRDGLRRVDFRINTTNLLNHVNYTGLSTVMNSATFGSVTGAGSMRSFSFTTRVNF